MFEMSNCAAEINTSIDAKSINNIVGGREIISRARSLTKDKTIKYRKGALMKKLVVCAKRQRSETVANC